MKESRSGEAMELKEEPWIGGSGLASLSIGAIGLWPSSGSLGILGIVLGPLGIYLARVELQRIETGERSPRGEGIARTGLVLGIIQTVLGALWLVVGVTALIITIASTSGG